MFSQCVVNKKVETKHISIKGKQGPKLWSTEVGGKLGESEKGTPIIDVVNNW